MKRIVLIAVTLVIALSLFADDALVLPKNVFRFRVADSYVSGDEAYNGDGEAQETNEFSVMNLAFALEYGATDWITAALQWAPGYNFNSDIEPAVGHPKTSIDGCNGLFAGAKFQLLGTNCPFKNEKFRFAFATGALIPLSFGYDIEAEVENVLSGKDFNAQADKNAFGLGGRVYADYVISDFFFVNLYGEMIKYLPLDADKDFQALSYNTYLDKNSIPASMKPRIEEVDYGYKLTAQFDPHVSYNVSETVTASFNLPVTYTKTPAVKWDGETKENSHDSWGLSINPNLCIGLWGLPLPMEFSVSYDISLAGENGLKTNCITIQWIPYFSF